MMKYILISILTISFLSLQAQGDRAFVRMGNQEYEAQNFSNAEENYRKALEDNPSNRKGAHNLGNAIYEQTRYEEAVKHFETAAALSSTKETKAHALHNLGNTYLELKQYDASVQAYIESLKNNPKDLDTKYNLAYALQKLKEQQQQEQEQDQEQNQENQDSEKEEKDQEQKEGEQENQEQKENKENQEQSEQEQQQKEQEQKNSEDKDIKQENEQEGEPKPQEMSRQEVMKILEVMDNEERKVQEKMRMTKGKQHKPEKDW